MMNMKMMWSFGIILTLLLLHVDARFDFMSITRGTRCNSCLEASRKADKALKNKDMFNDVNVLSNQVCQSLPSDLQSKCLRKSSDQIEQSRVQMQEIFHEQNLCNKTGLCFDEVTDVIDNKNSSENTNCVNRADECSDCTYAIENFIYQLADPKVKNKVTDAALDYCDESEGNRKRCKQAVYRYGRIVLHKLEQVKAKDLCMVLNLCDVI
ncbi:uncharacterized protein LOC120263965 [Dioscorea cayenensis subsp. rotundata]|uniref:Uncharacterized protein LOC120263965 n=1 Tax=Dioscorea cayennensis subsp. rotundata TaxID=55577 RepID=A0AB40BLK3_DIOCR|nr:uncharacterized protein LOC120263965 [Dioscorea cayenensis subsp. rotundata]